MKKIYITLLTLMRIPLTLLFCSILALKSNPFFPCLFVFTLIVGSDILDGQLARKYGMTSALGASLDVGADFFFVSSTTLLWSYKGFLPSWVITLIVLKFLEFLLTSFIKRRRKWQENPFQFDILGRFVAIVFYLLPIVVLLFTYTGFSDVHRWFVWFTCIILAGLSLLSTMFRFISLLKSW